MFKTSGLKLVRARLSTKPVLNTFKYQPFLLRANQQSSTTLLTHRFFSTNIDPKPENEKTIENQENEKPKKKGRPKKSESQA